MKATLFGVSVGEIGEEKNMIGMYAKNNFKKNKTLK